MPSWTPQDHHRSHACHSRLPCCKDIDLAKFQSQFDGAGRTLTNSVWAVTKDGGEFDAIAGATITPRAIIRAVAAGLEFFEVKRDLIFGESNCPEKYVEQFPQCKSAKLPDSTISGEEL